jgi:hypothetical protein
MDLLTEAADIFARKNAMPVLPQDDQVGPPTGAQGPVGMEKSSEVSMGFRWILRKKLCTVGKKPGKIAGIRQHTYH